MIDIPISHNHTENRVKRQIPDCLPCIVCGCGVKTPKHYVRVFWGGTAVTNDEAKQIIAEKGAGGDLLYYPVGPDCLRKYPELKPYVEDAKLTLTKEETNEEV